MGDIDRYVVNDALTALAGGRLSDDDLNELTHTVADAIDKGFYPPIVTDEAGIPVVRLPGSMDWENAFKFGQTLAEQFPGQDGGDLATAMEYNGSGPVSQTNGITNLIMERQGARDSEGWIWCVFMQDGTVWTAEGWCDYTGWDCQSNLTWTQR